MDSEASCQHGPEVPESCTNCPAPSPAQCLPKEEKLKDSVMEVVPR